SDDIEPTVRIIEETPRAQLVETMATHVRAGMSYREVLAGLLLAGVRNVEPRPHVGFKFHAVLVVNSAHLASLASSDTDRWLPIFWALDYFKVAQAQDIQERNWTMPAVDESQVPRGSRAVRQFREAMDHWDVPAADRAVAGLSRSAGMAEIFELLFRYGARDLRDIGHKAIFTANSYRTLQCIGWEHAEPVLRSLAYALLNHTNEPNPGQSDLELDRPWREHERVVAELPADWMAGEIRADATQELLTALREASSSDIIRLAIQMMKRGVSPQSIWDAIFLAASELLMQQPGIIALHALTSSNALHFAFRTVADDETRRLMLLQNLAFICHFRQRIQPNRDKNAPGLSQLPVDPGETDAVTGPEMVFSQLRSDPLRSARLAYSYLSEGGQAGALIDEARRLVFLKGTNSHDYKFSSAVLEDYFHISPNLRDQYLAATTFQLHGAEEQDNALVARIRSALG
ncbi:MAG TPA: hypothetical protein VIY86_06570, partial [Pirellulaceae bacterium]